MGHDYAIPNKANYFVASEVSVWFKKMTSVGVYGNWMPLGNIDESSLTPDITKLTHNTNQRGIDKKDKEVVIAIGANVKITIDEIVRHNLEYVIGSSGRSASQSVNINEVETPTLVASVCSVNGGSAIVSVDEVRALDGTLYTEGASADYTVSLSTGTITRQAGGSIGATDQLVVYFSRAITASKYAMFDDPNPQGRLAILSAGANNMGPQRYIYFPDVNISLDGDLPLTPKTEWQKASLNCSVNEDASEGYGTWYNFG